jgi:hypothetical protein
MTEGGRLKEIAFDLYERYILLNPAGAHRQALSARASPRTTSWM